MRGSLFLHSSVIMDEPHDKEETKRELTRKLRRSGNHFKTGLLLCTGKEPPSLQDLAVYAVARKNEFNIRREDLPKLQEKEKPGRLQSMPAYLHTFFCLQFTFSFSNVQNGLDSKVFRRFESEEVESGSPLGPMPIEVVLSNIFEPGSRNTKPCYDIVLTIFAPLPPSKEVVQHLLHKTFERREGDKKKEEKEEEEEEEERWGVPNDDFDPDRDAEVSLSTVCYGLDSSDQRSYFSVQADPRLFVNGQVDAAGLRSERNMSEKLAGVVENGLLSYRRRLETIMRALERRKYSDCKELVERLEKRGIVIKNVDPFFRLYDMPISEAFIERALINVLDIDLEGFEDSE